MRIMTSNIWGDYFGNEVSSRENQLFNVYKKYDADVIGFQEVTESWYKSELFKKLSEDYMLIGTELYNSTNYVPIAIKKNYSLIAKGFEYLENTPDKSKSVSWAVFKSGTQKIAVCNTHFWWMDGNQSDEDKKILEPVIGEVAYWPKEEHDKLRTQNAKQMVALMKQLKERFDCPVFSFGDMNTTISADVFRIYDENSIRRLFELTEEKDTVCSIHGNPKRGSDGRFHGEKTTGDYKCSIDHIVGLGNEFTVSQYRIVEDQDALDATDHSPVYADINFK